MGVIHDCAPVDVNTRTNEKQQEAERTHSTVVVDPRRMLFYTPLYGKKHCRNRGDENVKCKSPQNHGIIVEIEHQSHRCIQSTTVQVAYIDSSND